jgi:Ca2+-transporting ATPase
MDISDIFTPVHVISWIMGPMCSIVYENEPAEKNGMQQMPRQLGSTFYHSK